MNLTEKMILNISQPTNADDLRALYREVKAGAPMPHALVHAACNALADKDCAAKARRAFEALGLRCGHGYGASPDVLDAAAARGDFLAVLRLSGGDRTDLWAAAMTAHYGPTGLHQAWCNSNGTPSAEALAKFPEIAQRMEDARERTIGLIDWYRRYESRNAA